MKPPFDEAKQRGRNRQVARSEVEDLGAEAGAQVPGGLTRLAGLRKMVVRGERKPKVRKFPRWPRRRPVRWLRRLLINGVVFPLVRAGYGVEVRGRSRFRSVEQPCLVVSNHNMHLDQSVLLHTMPGRFRRRVAIAAAASDIFGNRFRGFGASLLGNAFPFAKEGGGVRESLDNVGRMLAEGWNVLIFPEGKLTVMGPMRPFKGGIGFLAVETGVPVLPIRIDVLRPGFYEGRWLPHPRARVRVSVGEPVTFAAGTRYAQAAAMLEKAVREA